MSSNQNIFAAFSKLTSACIDTSSIIYMVKAGYFSIASTAIQFYTIPEILSELVHPNHSDIDIQKLREKIFLLTKNENKEWRSRDVGRDVDYKLFLAAKGEGLSMVSEDKKLLLYCREAEINYYNSLMILLSLFYKSCIDEKAYSQFREKLLSFARYTNRIVEYERFLYLSIVKGLRE